MMPKSTPYKCSRCGRSMELIQELGRYGVACSNVACAWFYDYELYDTEDKALAAAAAVLEGMS